jgi:hypothetical protein
MRCCRFTGVMRYGTEQYERGRTAQRRKSEELGENVWVVMTVPLNCEIVLLGHHMSNSVFSEAHVETKERY